MTVMVAAWSSFQGYGDLGSTYDLQNGGRPLRRSEAAVVVSTPWATQQPVGLARLLPGDLRGTPKLGDGPKVAPENQPEITRYWDA